MNISKLEALSILNITDSEAAADAYEEMLFTWKQKYLGVLPPIKVIKAHILKIERLHSAGEVFMDFDKIELTEVPFDITGSTLVEALEMYQPKLMGLKLKISSTYNGAELIAVLSAVITMQISVMEKLATYLPNTDIVNLKDVKISSPTDYHAVHKELKEKDISETEIMNYLRAELKFGSYPFESALLNEVLKAKKQKT